MSNAGTGRKQPTAISRMKQDYMRLKRDPLPYITAEPLPNNILEWHYVVKGPEDSPYYGGYYHGTLLFPREFPFKPPSIYMMTPNGRFKTNSRLCLSISDFHPDTWNPTWCVGTILTGLLSFMLETTPTLGSIETSTYEKQQLANKSLAFNLKNANFRELFPDIVEEIEKRLKEERIQAFGKSGSQDRYLTINSTGINEVDGVQFINNNNNKNNNNNNNNNNQVAGGAIKSKSCLNWQAFYTNLIIVISFAIFALIVNYVFKSLNQE